MISFIDDLFVANEKMIKVFHYIKFYIIMGEKNHVMWKKILKGGKIFKNIF